MDDLICKLYEINCIKIGDFNMKNKPNSPILMNLKKIIAYPYVLEKLCDIIWNIINKCYNVNLICGINYSVIPLVSILSYKYKIPQIIIKENLKKKNLDGIIPADANCVLIDYVIISGKTLNKYRDFLMKNSITLSKSIVIYNNSGSSFTDVISLISVNSIVNTLYKNDKININLYNKINKIINNSLQKRKIISKNNTPIYKKLINIIEKKKTNITLSLELDDIDKILKLVNNVGAYICILKIQINVIKNVTNTFIDKLKNLSIKFNFLIFESRPISNNIEFLDLEMQKYEIGKWCDIISINIGTTNEFISKLSHKYKNLGIILEMNYNIDYSNNVLEIYNNINLLGIIKNKRIDNDDNLYFSYINNNIENTFKNDIDIIIIGKEIINSENQEIEVIKYRDIAWNFYNYKRI